MNDETIKCPNCYCEEFLKRGRSYKTLKTIWWTQKYQCKNCKRNFKGKARKATIPEAFIYKSKPIPTQNWSAYTLAQNEHKKGMMEITKEMLELIEIKQQTRVGRPNAHLKDICFSLMLKTFSQLSSRRLHGELELAKQLEYIQYLPHFTVTMKYLRPQSAEPPILLFDLPYLTNSSRQYNL